MTPFFVNIIWLFFSVSVGWFIFERTRPKEKRVYRSITIIGFISWFVFKTLHRAVITSKGTPGACGGIIWRGNLANLLCYKMVFR